MDALKTRKVKWHTESRCLSQIPHEGLEYALVSKEWDQIHQFVLCKDFLQDAVFGFLNGLHTKVYGFEYQPGTDKPILMEKARLMVTNYKDKDFGTKVVKNLLPFLNKVEEKLKMAKTTAVVCADPPLQYKKSGVYILEGSPRWMKSPPMISLYTMLIRIGMIANPKDSVEETLEKVKTNKVSTYYKSGDDKFARDAEKGINRIFAEGDRKIFKPKARDNFPTETVSKTGDKTKISAHLMHDYLGVCGFSNGTTEKYIPFWHKTSAATPTAVKAQAPAAPTLPLGMNGAM